MKHRASRALADAVKLSSTRQYKLAHQIGVDPSSLSAWLNGIYHVPPAHHVRVLRLAEILGVPPEEALVPDPNTD